MMERAVGYAAAVDGQARKRPKVSKEDEEEREKKKQQNKEEAKGKEDLGLVLYIDPPKPKQTRKESDTAKQAFLQFHR